MSGHLQTLSFPIVADFLGTVLHRVTDVGRALLRTQPAANKLAAVKAMRSGGKAACHLVGAGPGDPELLTLKALRALQAADVILHDQLVSADVLALAPPHVERIDVGKKGYGRACRQGDINDLMVALANAGRRVVRLKAGDPLMFGRLEEEIAALEAAGIAFDVIPGISAAQGAAARLGVPLTRRRGARRFQAITGHASDGRLPGDFDWSGACRPEGDHRRLYAQGDHRRAVRRADAPRTSGGASGRRRVQRHARRRDRHRRDHRNAAAAHCSG